jgi:hypothetical protein
MASSKSACKNFLMLRHWGFMCTHQGPALRRSLASTALRRVGGEGRWCWLALNAVAQPSPFLCPPIARYPAGEKSLFRSSSGVSVDFEIDDPNAIFGAAKLNRVARHCAIGHNRKSAIALGVRAWVTQDLARHSWNHQPTAFSTSHGLPSETGIYGTLRINQSRSIRA